MTVGFTGTRSGMTDRQKETVGEFLEMLLPKFGLSFIHGDAVGSDKEAASIAIAIGYAEYKIPANGDPLSRNRTIAKTSEFMLATPSGYAEIQRSGTWATIRYSRQYQTPGIIIWPNGSSSPITSRSIKEY